MSWGFRVSRRQQPYQLDQQKDNHQCKDQPDPQQPGKMRAQQQHNGGIHDEAVKQAHQLSISSLLKFS